MKKAFRSTRLGPKTKVMLCTVLALALGFALFDWNWLRHPLERYLTDKSHRSVTIGDLHISLNAAFEPTVRLRDLRIENAPWAAAKPLAVAGEVSFTFSPRALWEKPHPVARIALRDADIDLERQADGLRNWRLRHPDDRSPGKYKILALDAQRSTIRFANRAIDLDFVASSSDLHPGTNRVGASATLADKIDFSGVYRGARFSGTTLAGALLTLQETGKSFPLRGHVTVGKTRVEVDGGVADLLELSAIDAKVTMAGPTIANLYPFLRLPLPQSNSYRIEGRLTHAGEQYTFSRFRGKIGGTDIAGDASYRDSERPLLKATLVSQSLDLADLGSMVGAGQKPDPGGKAQPPAGPEGQNASAPGATGHVLPDHTFQAERLRAIDLHLTLEAKKVKTPHALALESLRFTADLNDGVLDLKPIEFGLAGGRAVASINVNAKKQPLSSRATIDFRNIQIDQLFAALPIMAHSAGSIDAQLKLAGQGNSIAAMLGHASGTLAVTMDGGRISNLLDAALGLNGGKALSLAMGGDKTIGIRCGAIAFDFEHGVGHSRTILFDTDQTRTDGTGTIDLGQETLDLVLTPRPKKPTILSARSPIRVQGSFGRVDVSIDKGAVLARAGAAAALAALNPLALFIPLVEPAQARDSACAAVLASIPVRKP